MIELALFIIINIVLSHQINPSNHGIKPQLQKEELQLQSSNVTQVYDLSDGDIDIKTNFRYDAENRRVVEY